jgi:hypothetical protein
MLQIVTELDGFDPRGNIKVSTWPKLAATVFSVPWCFVHCDSSLLNLLLLTTVLFVSCSGADGYQQA